MAERFEDSPHVLSARQFDREYMNKIFHRADEFADPLNIHEAEWRLTRKFIGKIAMTRIFFEPSTRTLDSSVAAAHALGMKVLGTPFAKVSSSVAKGESLVDYIETENEIISSVYAGGLIVMRHPEAGSAALAAEVSRVPIINAGDGQNEHPTQALLDIFTIRQHFKTLKGLHIVLGGDPRYSRTIHSLVEAIATIESDVEFTFLSGADLWIDEDIKHQLRDRGINFSETDDMDKALKMADVFYMTRKQEDRIEEPEKADPEYESKMEVIKRARAEYRRYFFRSDSLEKMKENAILMHPGPQAGEIEEVPRNHPKNAVRRQVKHGPRIRAAVFEKSLYLAKEQGWYEQST